MIEPCEKPIHPPDPPGLCPRCKESAREFTTVHGTDYCHKCGKEVADLRALFRDYKQLVGTGEP